VLVSTENTAVTKSVLVLAVNSVWGNKQFVVFL